LTEASPGSLTRGFLWRSALILAGCGAAVYFMTLIFDIRVRELKASLKNLNNSQTSFRTLALISRYQLIRDRMTRNDEAGQFKSEGKTMLALGQTTAGDEGDRVTFLDRFGIAMINALNWLTGADPLRNYQTSLDQRTLELAYLYEIRRDYARAVEVYDLALKMIPERNQEALQYAYLHRGFCLSLMDKKNEALADYSIVISSNETGEFRYTAEILSALLKDLLEKSGKIDNMSDSEDKAEAYYKLAAYPKAFAVYDRLQSKGVSLSARGTYYAGRVHEEMGQSEKAAEKFRALVAQPGGSDWALRANRRIYALGAFYGGDKKYREESQKNAVTVVKDKELVQAAEKFEAVVQQNETVTQKRQAEINETAALVKEEKENLEKKAAVVPVAAAPQAAVPAAAPAPAPPAQPAPSLRVPAPLPAPAPAAKAEVAPAAPAPKAEPAKPAEPTPEEKLQTALRRGDLTRAEKKEILMTFKEIERIVLNDDNELWGIPIKEEKDLIFFFTVMGKVHIAKSRIKTREKIDSDEAFR